MAIQSGTRLGPYEVASLIGAGGMGEVYQAHDTKLGRDVAIKVLPEQFAHDPERLARFQREAKMLAALNHPNIAAIYGLEQSGDTHYLVMELVPGETLRERVAGGRPVPVEEALTIAKQIAEALEAAHGSEKGIIHRDLKPANVKVTPEGRVKVLDFGLAKAFAAETTPEEIGNSPTLSMAATMRGVILGTAAYMSPEQARGKAVTKATDIWAFGAVLYEMLTGKQAFHGDDVSDILAAVIRAEPDWSKLSADTPSTIRTLLKRCLRKDRQQRLQDAASLRIEIEDVLSGSAQAEPTATAVISRRPVGWIVAAGAALVMALALAVPAIVHLREVPVIAPAMRTEIVTPSTTDPVSFALSPDGRAIVFAASGDGPSRLWLRRLDATEAQPLAGTEGAFYPFWSPDSRWVAFFADTKLRRMDITGSSQQALAAAASGRGGAWNQDGTILFASDATSVIVRIPASGGGPVAVTKLTGKQTSHRFPQFLPDGRRFLFYVLGAPADAGIYLGSLDSPEIKRLAAADTAGAYLSERAASTSLSRSPNGWLLFLRGGTLFAQRFDSDRGELTGDPVTVANEVAFANFGGAFSVSNAGLMAYRPGEAGQRQLIWFDRSGKMLGIMGAPDSNGLSAPSLSPDGRRAAVHRAVQGNVDIWLVDATRTTRFTFDPSIDRFPVWSPDGNQIVFDTSRKGHRDLYVKAASGAGSEEPLLESSDEKAAFDWSLDGRFLAYINLDQSGGNLEILPMQGERKPIEFLATGFRESRSQFSPDGRWLAYHSNESGRYEIYVRPFNGNGTSGGATGGQWQVSTSGGMSPRWRADGKELYYIAPDGKLMVAPITVRRTTFEPGTPMALFQTRIHGGGTNPDVGIQYDVGNDGRFLINTVLEEANSPITLLQNWNPEAKK